MSGANKVVWLMVFAVLSGLAIALAAVSDRAVGITVGVAIALGWVAWISRYAPLGALRWGFLLILVAETEFRVRDPLAATGGSIDGQVAFELAVYGFVAWITGMWILRLRRSAMRLSALELAVVLYVVFALLSTLWSPISTYTFVRAGQLAILLAYALVVTRTLGPDGAWRAAMHGVIAYVCFCSVVALPVSWVGLSTPVGQRFSWFEVHPITSGTLLGLASIHLAAGFLFRDGTERASRFRPFMFAVLTILMVLTIARGPITAFFVSGLSLVLLRVLRRSIATVGVVAITGFALFVLNVPGGLVGIVEDVLGAGIPWIDAMARGQGAEELLSMTGRMTLWKAMFPGFLDHPVIGHGYQVARLVGIQVVPWAGEAHNAILQSLIELGVIGTALLVAPIVAVLATTYRSLASARKQSAVVAGVFAAVLFQFVNAVGTAGFAGSPGFDPLILFTAVAVAAGRPSDFGLRA